MNREEGVKAKLKIAFQTMLDENLPGAQLESKVERTCEILAKALTETYDSSKDPIVLAYIASTINIFGGNLTTGQVAIPSGTVYTFNHNLGYIPVVTIVSNNTTTCKIFTLTENSVTLYCWDIGGNTTLANIYCN